MRRVVILLITLLIVSCSSPTPEINVIDTTVDANKPKAPEPINVYDIQWHVIDGNVCLSAPDGVKLNTQSKESVKYIKELQKLVCYYENNYNFCQEEKISD